ncbi:MAG TPA: NAD(P)/FAD-dependent oxidoreductase [Gemmataceae bacterium]|jgi:NADH dehydrogenase
MDSSHRVAIVGGGFGGLYAAQALRKANVRVTLIDRRNFHLFQPLLYQVATGGLSPANIASPLRAVLKRQKNTRVLLGEVVGFDLERRLVQLRDGSEPYDSLIVATGARHHYFGHPEWECYAPGLKSVEDATAMRRNILSAFERAERCTDAEERQALLTFVVVGGGPTGVELAGSVAEMAHSTLRGNFRSIDPAHARILLLEGLDRILSAYPPKLSDKAVKSLTRIGVTARTGTVVTDVRPDRVTVRSGDRTEVIRTCTVLWGAGVDASPLAKELAKATGAEVDRSGRIVVQPDLSLPGHPEVFVIGDMANYPYQGGKPLPGVAQVAMQQGRYVADLIQRRLQGAAPLHFRYNDRGTMATIGRAAAVADLGWIRLSGTIAWLIWLFVHILFLIEFQNRILVMLQWAWNYFTRNRAARLITGTQPPAGETEHPDLPSEPTA